MIFSTRKVLLTAISVISDAGRPAIRAARTMRSCTACRRADIVVIIFEAPGGPFSVKSDRRTAVLPGFHHNGAIIMDIAELLAFVVKNKASDLHLSAGLPPMIRVHGDVRRINLPPLEHKDVHAMVYDIMNDGQRKFYEENLECRSEEHTSELQSPKDLVCRLLLEKKK